ncbi:MAG: hypothetical protein D3917_09395 [Candidatus Electrothrix sp. AX5]|nr:hypothetical protein [Candidatus Electrothrix sp. AX5]
MLSDYTAHQDYTDVSRIGMVNDINTALIYEVWKEQVYRPNWPVTGRHGQAAQLAGKGQGGGNFGCKIARVCAECFFLGRMLSISRYQE